MRKIPAKLVIPTRFEARWIVEGFRLAQKRLTDTVASGPPVCRLSRYPLLMAVAIAHARLATFAGRSVEHLREKYRQTKRGTRVAPDLALPSRRRYLGSHHDLGVTANVRHPRPNLTLLLRIEGHAARIQNSRLKSVARHRFGSGEKRKKGRTAALPTRPMAGAPSPRSPAPSRPSGKPSPSYR